MVPIRIHFGGDFPFRLNSPVAANVLHLNSVVDQHPAYQQAPVAGRWIFLGAQDGHLVFPDSPLQPPQPLLKQAGRRDAVIQHVAFAIVKFIPLGPSAQFPPKKQVTNPRVLQSNFQRFVIKLRGVLGIGLRTGIYDHLNGMRFQ